MAERQIHGFNYQRYIIDKYHLNPVEGYTDEWDAYYKGIPVSIKNKQLSGNAGKAFADKNGAISSNYYIINKTSLSVEQLIKILNTIKYPSIEFTVGPKSLPKGELILEIESVLLDK